jgi:urease accessory protein
VDRARAAASGVADRPLQRDDRAAGAIGRTALRELAFEVRGGRTILAHAYAEPPFRIGRVLPRADAAWMILAATAPGAFGGDSLDQSVRVGRGARVALTSQSALQVHPQAGLDAALRTTCVVEDEADLTCEWDPVIPFAASQLRQRIEIALAPGATLFWSDAMMSGRCGHGEAWQFRSLHHELRVRRGDPLIYLERYRLSPGERDGDRAFAAGGCDYLGTVVIVRPSADEAMAEGLQRATAGLDDVRVGADCLEPGLVVARLLGRSGPAFAAARRAIREAAVWP